MRSWRSVNKTPNPGSTMIEKLQASYLSKYMEEGSFEKKVDEEKEELLRR